MNNSLDARKLSIDMVCETAQMDAQAFILAEEKRYHAEVEAVADTVHNAKGNRHFILLCGPSSAGKTTTAKLLKAALNRRGTVTHVVSLDDFYLGRGKAPLLSNGEPDYETIDALDVNLLGECFTELVRDGKTNLPIFDFQLGCPRKEKVLLELEEDAAVIVEGIHAFHPKLQQYLPAEMTTRLFINTLSRFVKGDAVWLARRDIRLCRRILRDDQFRASPFSNTMKMWPQVVRGEELYMFPYADTADCVIDTTFAFEPCILRDYLLQRLLQVDTEQADYATAQYLIERLSAFSSISLSLLPQDSMLREFTG